MIFRVLADGQSAAFIINALNRKDQWNLFEVINISTYLEVEEVINKFLSTFQLILKLRKSSGILLGRRGS